MSHFELWLLLWRLLVIIHSGPDGPLYIWVFIGQIYKHTVRIHFWETKYLAGPEIGLNSGPLKHKVSALSIRPKVQTAGPRTTTPYNISPPPFEELEGHSRCWPLYIQAVCYAYNTFSHTSLRGYSHFEMVYARPPPDHNKAKGKYGQIKVFVPLTRDGEGTWNQRVLFVHRLSYMLNIPAYVLGLFLETDAA